ncbi:MAG: prolipoprotein diacylglyceryl transferase family protein [Planctomycetota bacterium]
MRSELFRIPVEWGGVPIFGFGVLLVLWLAVSAVAAWRMRDQPEWKQELSAWAPVFGIVTAVLIFLPRFLPTGVPIRGYGVMLVIASATGLAMAVHRAKQRGIDADTVLSMVFGMFILGIAGARLFFVIEYWEVAFAPAGLWGAIQKAVLFTEGGLVVYGSLIGGAAAFALFCMRKKLPLLAMADILAPSLVVGLAIGRIGCLLNGCCYGGVCDAPWAIQFPADSPPYSDQLTSGDFHGFHWERHPSQAKAVVTRVTSAVADAGLAAGDEIVGVAGSQTIPSTLASRAGEPPTLGDVLVGAYRSGQPVTLNLASGEAVSLPAANPREGSLPVHPTQVYSAIHAALLGWLLWEWYPLRRRDGEVIGLLLTLYPIGRFLLEDIRTDESSFFGTGLSISQNISVAMLALMLGYWAWLLRRPRVTAEQLATA